MKKIYKYPLEVTDVQDIEMPKGSAFLCVQAQKETPCLWVAVDASESSKIKRRFRTYGTGQSMVDAENFFRYVGTYQLGNGGLVFHVFTDGIEYP